jgi:polysaccharide export outer membrane protein
MRTFLTRLALSGALGLAVAPVAFPAGGAGTSEQDGNAKPNETAKVVETYRIGPGDVLEVNVFDNEDLSRLVTVQHAGEISFPLLGDIQVAELTVREVRERLTELLAKDYLVNPQVVVKVKEYRSQWVTLVGEVARPGKYYLDGPKTLLELLTEAGGFTQKAGGEVAVTRLTGAFEDGTTLVKVRLARDMPQEEQKRALALGLSSGDLVTVAAEEFCYVTGEVKTPGSYPLTGGLTVLKAISLAGGLTKFGAKGKVEILRKNAAGEPERIKVDLDEIESGKKPDLPLAAEDIIKVGKRVF